MFNFSSAATIACGGNTPIPGDGFGQANNYCCQPVVMGCIDSNADQITPGANTSDGTSCTYTGCTNPLASNYSFTGSNPFIKGCKFICIDIFMMIRPDMIYVSQNNPPVFLLCKSLVSYNVYLHPKNTCA